MVIVLSEPVGFVAYILKQTQCEGITSESQRFFFTGAIDFFFAFCKGD